MAEEKKPHHGRKKGTPNRVTKETRELFADFVKGNFWEFKNRLQSLDDDKYCKIYIDMCKYVMPSLQSVSLDATVESKKTIEDTLLKLSEE